MKLNFVFSSRYAGMSGLLIHVKELIFAAGLEEPYYCSLSVHDIKSKTRLCENFHFQTGRDEFLRLWNQRHPFTSTLRCFVPLPTQMIANNISIYIIIRIEKLISSDIEKDFSKYSKRTVRLSFSFFDSKGFGLN
jgi:hypothetical protein